MSKEKTLPISIICLSIAIIISAVVISKGMQNNGLYINSGLSDIKQGLYSIGSTADNVNTSSVVYVRGTYDLPTASGYLGISVDELKKIVSNKNSGIPYIKIGENYVFSKNALDKWLETARVEIK